MTNQVELWKSWLSSSSSLHNLHWTWPRKSFPRLLDHLLPPRLRSPHHQASDSQTYERVKHPWHDSPCCPELQHSFSLQRLGRWWWNNWGTQSKIWSNSDRGELCDGCQLLLQLTSAGSSDLHRSEISIGNSQTFDYLVMNISARHNVLLDTIGPREEEVECYKRALWYFWTFISIFLVCSLLELLFHLVYSCYVRLWYRFILHYIHILRF